MGQNPKSKFQIPKLGKIILKKEKIK